MIEYVKGSVFDTNCDIIAHGPIDRDWETKNP